MYWNWCEFIKTYYFLNFRLTPYQIKTSTVLLAASHPNKGPTPVFLFHCNKIFHSTKYVTLYRQICRNAFWKLHDILMLILSKSTSTNISISKFLTLVLIFKYTMHSPSMNTSSMQLKFLDRKKATNRNFSDRY